MDKDGRIMPEYRWDTTDIPLCATEDLPKVLINGAPLGEYASDTKLSRRLKLRTNNVTLAPRNMFGEIQIGLENTTKKYRIVPAKLFPHSEQEPSEAYEAVKNHVIGELENFTSMIVQKIKDIQTLEFLRISMEDIAYSHEFLVILLRRYTEILKKATWELFSAGPIHRAQISVNGYFGNTVTGNAFGFADPYPRFTRRGFTYNTPLNTMVFQALYYTALEAAFIKGVLKAVSRSKERDARRTLDRIIRDSMNTINKYHLWPFYSKEPLDVGMLASLAVRQQNTAYRKIFRIYSELLRILYAENLSATSEIDFPLIGFEHIYEIWAISQLLHALGDPQEVRAGRRGAKMFFKVGERVEVYWELRRPLSESLYLGSIQKAKNIPRAVWDALQSTHVKPDIVVLSKSEGRVRKAIVGDVKFKVDENGYLPKIDDVYKVLGYVLDLGRTDMFEGVPVEGMLIYPGALEEPVKLPLSVPSGNSTNTVYIHLIPLRINSKGITEYVRRIVESQLPGW